MTTGATHYVPGQGSRRTHDGPMAACPSTVCQQVAQVEARYQESRRRTEVRPSLPCEPVLLIHVEDPGGSGLAACCGEPFRVPNGDEYPNVGRYACPGCMIRFREGK